MLKVCAIHSFKSSAWVSCQKIVANLLKAYQSNSDCFDVFPINFNETMTDYEAYLEREKIHSINPDIVLFLDHKPHPLPILTWLHQEFEEYGRNPKYIFHLYGDFTLCFRFWASSEKLIAGKQVMWYAASDRQKAMLSEFIPVEQIQVCPFPVDKNEFYLDESLRNKFRKKMGWKDDEFIFLFTGRLSRQKRSHQLIKLFSQWRSSSNAKAKLVFVGECDKVGEPWLLKGEYEGEYFHYLQHHLNALTDEERSRIEFHGFRPNKELIGYYNAADSLVNISVHNDEDYGMSCAEALACGLPLVLTSWAGFSSFQTRTNLNEEVCLVPVKIAPKGKLIHAQTLIEKFEFMYHTGRKFDRQKIQKQAMNWVSIESAAKIVANIDQNFTTFTAFTQTMKRACESEVYNKSNTFTNVKLRAFNPLYMQVYRHYVGQS